MKKKKVNSIKKLSSSGRGLRKIFKEKSPADWSLDYVSRILRGLGRRLEYRSQKAMVATEFRIDINIEVFTFGYYCLSKIIGL